MEANKLTYFLLYSKVIPIYYKVQKNRIMLKLFTNSQYRQAYKFLFAQGFLASELKPSHKQNIKSKWFQKVRTQVNEYMLTKQVGFFRQVFTILEDHKKEPITMMNVLMLIHFMLQHLEADESNGQDDTKINNMINIDLDVNTDRNQAQILEMVQNQLSTILQNSKRYRENKKQSSLRSSGASSNLIDSKSQNKQKNNTIIAVLTDHSSNINNQVSFSSHASTVMNDTIVQYNKDNQPQKFTKTSSFKSSQLFNGQFNNKTDKENINKQQKAAISNNKKFTGLKSLSNFTGRASAQSINLNKSVRVSSQKEPHKQSFQQTKMSSNSNYQVSSSQQVLCEKFIQPYTLYLLKKTILTIQNNSSENELNKTINITINKQDQNYTYTKLWSQINLFKMIFKTTQGISVLGRYYKSQYLGIILNLVEILNFDIHQHYEHLCSNVRKIVQKVRKYKDQSASNVIVKQSIQCTSQNIDQYETYLTQLTDQGQTGNNRKKIKRRTSEQIIDQYLSIQLKQVKQLLKQLCEINEKLITLFCGKYTTKQFKERKIQVPKLLTPQSQQFQLIFYLIDVEQKKLQKQKKLAQNKNKAQINKSVHSLSGEFKRAKNYMNFSELYVKKNEQKTDEKEFTQLSNQAKEKKFAATVSFSNFNLPKQKYKQKSKQAKFNDFIAIQEEEIEQNIKSSKKIIGNQLLDDLIIFDNQSAANKEYIQDQIDKNTNNPFKSRGNIDNSKTY